MTRNPAPSAGIGHATEEPMAFVPAQIAQLKKMLTNLDGWLEKGVAHAKAKNFDPDVFVTARLAPDQYPLVRQVQAAADAAKFVAARLSGKEAPKHADTEQTIEQLRARIRAATGFLDTLKASDFSGAESRIIELPFLEGKVLSGIEYLVEMAVANFYFHVTTAYAILRHNGVELGKRDFIGHLPVRDK
jgi:hypothetical protein